jgi:type IV secretory pathway VirJ component
MGSTRQEQTLTTACSQPGQKRTDKLQRVALHAIGMNSVAWLVGVAAVLTAIAGCTSVEQVVHEHYADASAFDDASPLLGTAVAVRGYLVREFENKNLYPSKAAVDARHCLPLLVHRDRKDLLARAEAASGKFAVVRGKVTAGAPPGLVRVGTCKQITLEVDSIEAD